MKKTKLKILSLSLLLILNLNACSYNKDKKAPCSIPFSFSTASPCKEYPLNIKKNLFQLYLKAFNGERYD